ncbi:hypothetical protein CPB84DRAFT_1817510 [Gymnopilus junonius]|uniref:Uncharacterized protein n=1 Tax=Gymnopilus junonius TaxID=109634 RepID=A0A9P5THJ0_GYMJU|nr:hypothetical protein CPB84DRAFT_1817510 [Gymnopilus junonius]
MKRKDRPEETEEKPSISAGSVPSLRPDEYETGRVTCETCGASVSFRDEQTGGFTHRRGAGQAHRRRANEYLRADPYVGKFEAYRVLCASCDKWIRLRPNSTYCSIPWDAHRKSCSQRRSKYLFSKDPDVRKFDPERILCNSCDKWISVPPDDHLQAVQHWLQHRASCQRNSGSSSVSAQRPEPPPSANIASAPHTAHPPHGAPNERYAPLGSPSSFHDLTPSNYAPAHESRRRNAEQRAATLRADRLIGEVEPNRVFCSLCQKWVQLRQDSSYCAYPWLQHRGKCLARQIRHTSSLDAESEEGVDREVVEDIRRKEPIRRPSQNEGHFRHASSSSRHPYHPSYHHPQQQHHHTKIRSVPYNTGPTNGRYGGGGSMSHAVSSCGCGGEPDPDGDYFDQHRQSPPTPASVSARVIPIARGGVPRRPWPVGLADLDSPSGRKHFVFGSVEYLFATTYEASDEMSISALLAYLNAAMPQDKHEDFDTSEVARAVQSMKEKGRVVFEGDILRLVD